MSNKLRLNSSHKAIRRGTTRKLAAAAADAACVDCDCADSTECAAITADAKCKTTTAQIADFSRYIRLPWTYKVEVTHNEIPGGADVSGWDEAFGNADRTYYVDIATLSPLGFVHGGVFFCGTKTTRTGSPHIKASGATEYDHISNLQFQLSDGGFADQKLTAQHIIGPSFWLFGGPSSSFWVTAVYDAEEGGFCRSVKTLDQNVVATANHPDITGIVQNGLYKFTPCPPCAIDCEGQQCAFVGISGGNAGDPIPDTGGVPRSDLGGLYCYVGKLPVGGPWSKAAGSAGCVWQWSQDTNNAIRGQLFVWFDGYEYQSILSWYGPDSSWGNAFHQVFYSSNGTQLECRAGRLSGAMSLGIYEDVIEATDQNESDCTAVASFSRDCGCPDDGTGCPPNIHVQFVGQGADAGDFEMPRNGTDAIWNWEGTLVNIQCALVGAPWYSPAKRVWLMDLYDQDTLTNHYVFVAEITCPRCPPDAAGSWTNLVGGSALAGTLLSVVYE